MKFASGDRVMAYPSIPPLLNPVMTRQPSRTALYTAVSGKIEQVRFLAFKRQKGCANEFGCSIYTKPCGENYSLITASTLGGPAASSVTFVASTI